MPTYFNGTCIIYCGAREEKQKVLIKCRRYSGKLSWRRLSQTRWAEKPSPMAWLSLHRYQHSVKYDTVCQTNTALQVKISRLKASSSMKLPVFLNIVTSHCIALFSSTWQTNTWEVPLVPVVTLYITGQSRRWIVSRERSRTFIISSSPYSHALQSA